LSLVPIKVKTSKAVRSTEIKNKEHKECEARVQEEDKGSSAILVFP
jgi:hypothetical protein